MGHIDRINRYRQQGGAADLVRVEVLVPAYARNDVVSIAEKIRNEHRHRKNAITPLLELAMKRYGAKIFDNIDIERLSDIRQKARVVGRALQERTDARGFVIGRALMAAAEA